MMKQTYWALSPTVDDERGRELYELRHGKQPLEIKRYPKSVLLIGPIDPPKAGGLKGVNDGNL